MNNKEYQDLLNTASEKLGKENSALVSDIFGTMISDNSEMNKTIQAKEKEIEKLQKTNEMLTQANRSTSSTGIYGIWRKRRKKRSGKRRKETIQF